MNKILTDFLERYKKFGKETVYSALKNHKDFVVSDLIEYFTKYDFSPEIQKYCSENKIFTNQQILKLKEIYEALETIDKKYNNKENVNLFWGKEIRKTSEYNSLEKKIEEFFKLLTT